MRLLFSSSLLLLLLAGCVSQRPVLYPNEQLRRVGSTIADRDVEQCMQQAEYYVSAESRAGKALEGVAAESVSSAAVGAAAGAAGGAVVGRPGIGAAVGAAGAGAASATRGLIHGIGGKSNPSPVYKSFVDRCLRDKGYDPIGWN